MSKYAVTIVETLCKTVVVEAADKDAAEEIVDRAYNEGSIVLDSEDYFDYMIEDVDEYDHFQHEFCEEL